jgi:uncharacterized OB-fold protein
MARTPESGEAETVGLPRVGEEGEVCAQCGSVMATDQRYCLNCGRRRGEPRVDYQTRMMNGAQATPPPPAQASRFQQSALFAVGTIALLGVMLLLGVLIGKEDNNTTPVAAQAPVTTTTASTPTETTAPTASNKKAAKKAAKGGTAAGQGNVEKGGSGSAEGVATVDTQALEEAARSGQGAQAGKNLPNQVATPGESEALDPNGQAGGGSSATCIGC